MAISGTRQRQLQSMRLITGLRYNTIHIYRLTMLEQCGIQTRLLLKECGIHLQCVLKLARPSGSIGPFSTFSQPRVDGLQPRSDGPQAAKWS